ncbi:MAG: HNH endonuclease [Leuconostoc mesenteroides]
MAKIIELTQGQFAIVDEEDFERVDKFKWRANRKKNGNFYARTHWRDENGRAIKKDLYSFVVNFKKEQQVDHINLNTLDCRRKNLRVATKQQNRFNTSVKETNKTKFKGVTFRGENIFEAKISCNKIYYKLGKFNNAEDAAKAYDKKAKELFGEFAWSNFKEVNYE